MQLENVIQNGNIKIIFKESSLIFDVDNKISTIFRTSQRVRSKIVKNSLTEYCLLLSDNAFDFLYCRHTNNNMKYKLGYHRDPRDLSWVDHTCIFVII